MCREPDSTAVAIVAACAQALANLTTQEEAARAVHQHGYPHLFNAICRPLAPAAVEPALVALWNLLRQHHVSAHQVLACRETLQSNLLCSLCVRSCSVHGTCWHVCS